MNRSSEVVVIVGGRVLVADRRLRAQNRRLRRSNRELEEKLAAVLAELGIHQDQDRLSHPEHEHCDRCGHGWRRWVDGEYPCWSCDG